MMPDMFNIGFLELFIIGAIALLVIGPKQLPEVASTIGRLLGDLKRATEDVTHTFLSTKKKTEDYIRDTGKEIKEGILEKNTENKVIKNKMDQNDLSVKVSSEKSVTVRDETHQEKKEKPDDDDNQL